LKVGNEQAAPFPDPRTGFLRDCVLCGLGLLR
jgi:hypothetical protein